MSPRSPTVRRLLRGDEALLREVRLRALAQAPFAFAETRARAAEKPASLWAERVAESERGDTGVVFALLDGDAAVGMAGGFVSEEATVQLWGVWVDPAARGLGAGTRLVGAVIDWARDIGAARIRLAVTEGEASAPAAALYRSLGFEPTGETTPLDDQRDLTAAVMVRGLRA